MAELKDFLGSWMITATQERQVAPFVAGNTVLVASQGAAAVPVLIVRSPQWELLGLFTACFDNGVVKSYIANTSLLVTCNALQRSITGVWDPIRAAAGTSLADGTGTWTGEGGGGGTGGTDDRPKSR